MTRPARTTATHLLAMAVGAVALGGVATAATRTGPSTVHVCVDRHTGAMRQVATCRSSERTLSLTRGATASIAPTVYSSYVTKTVAITSTVEGAATTVTLPSGQFDMSTQVQVRNDAASPVDVACSYRESYAGTWGYVDVPAHSDGISSVHGLIGVPTVGAGGNVVHVDCRLAGPSYGDSTATIVRSVLVATPVTARDAATP